MFSKLFKVYYIERFFKVGVERNKCKNKAATAPGRTRALLSASLQGAGEMPLPRS